MQTTRLLAAGIAPDPPAVSPPGSIIPALPALPGPVNITAPIVASGSYIVAAGQYVRGAELPHLFEAAPGSGQIAPFVNNGTIWSTVTSNVGTLIQLSRYGEVRDITNNGTMVVQAGPNVSVTTFAFHDTNMVNNGSIFVVSEGTSGAIMLESIGGTVTNNGMIAVKSTRTAATAFIFDNGGRVTNAAGASILVEGPRSNAIILYNDAQADSTGLRAGLTNDGLVQAVALDPAQYSTAVIAYHVYDRVTEVLNRGTIKADVAYISSYGTTTAKPGVDIITNEASGLIEGFFFLDRGDDIITNRGTIHGDIYMEEGADLVDNSGTIVGVVDLGWGADRFTGSGQADLVAGDDGDDLIEGNGGDDLLMGGDNNDHLVGGAGNDGLFGEYGDDVLITQSGDYVSGGDGNDRIEAGDFGFEIVDGGAGFDTLVLPGISRAIDLSAVLAQQGLADIEKIDMGGGQSLFIRATDIAALTGGETSLQIATHANDAVNLIGGWVAGANQVIGGVTYRSFSLSGATVLVAGTGNVTLNAAAGGTGLDPLSGTLAPVPGDGHGLDFTNNVRVLDRYELHQSITVNPETILTSVDGHAVLTSYALVTLTNYGQIISRREASSTSYTNAFGVGEGANNFERVINYGTISVDNLSTAGMGTFGLTTINGDAALDNYGTISVSGVFLTVQAAAVAYLTNQGHIRVNGMNSLVIGAQVTGAIFDNRGDITANGAGGDNPYGLTNTVAVWFRNGGDHVNDGVITATNSGAGGATAVWYEINAGTATFVNDGVLSGQAAIHVRSEQYYGGHGTLYLTNNEGASLIGRVELAGGDDRVVNKGTITGGVLLNDGNDIFDGSAGIQADVHGGLGNDQLTGGRGADRLFGDEGNDILKAGSGNDWLQGGAGADTFVFAAPGDSREYAQRSDGHKLMPDVIADFAPGTDKIDVSGIDAITGTAANDTFTFIGSAAFSHQAGQLRFETAGGHTTLFADMDGDGRADMQILLMTPVTLIAGDFVL